MTSLRAILHEGEVQYRAGLAEEASERELAFAAWGQTRRQVRIAADWDRILAQVAAEQRDETGQQKRKLGAPPQTEAQSWERALSGFAPPRR